MPPTKLEKHLNKLTKKQLTSLAYICQCDIKGCKTKKDLQQVLKSKSKSCDILKTLQTGVMTPLQVRKLLRLKKSVLVELAKEIGIKVTDKDTKWDIVHKMNGTRKGAAIGAIIGASTTLLLSLFYQTPSGQNYLDKQIKQAQDQTDSPLMKQAEKYWTDQKQKPGKNAVYGTLLSAATSASIGALIGDRYTRRRMDINKLLRNARKKSRKSRQSQKSKKRSSK